MDEVRTAVLERFVDPLAEDVLSRTTEVINAFEANLRETVRRAILEQGLRPDGRGP
jgi:polyribonucleotide nucleotidyltransferase